MPVHIPKIVHRLPGRIRLYLATLRSNPGLASRVITILEKQPGIIACKANPISGNVLIIYHNSTYTEEHLCNMVQHISSKTPHMRSSPKTRTAFQPEDMPIPAQIALVAVGGIVLAFHLICHMRGRAPVPRFCERATGFVTLTTAYPLLRSGIEDFIFHRKLNNEILIASATLLSLLLREGVTGLVVVWLVNVSTLVETLTLDCSRRTIRTMLEGHEKNAWLVVDDHEVSVPIAQLKPQDIICVKVGSKLPVDGTVVSGTASVNQAALTGEPVPVLRQPGDSVLAGSTIEQGTLYVRAEKVGDDTAVGRVIHLVEEASHSRAPIQKVADRYSARIIPASFLFAALVFLLTRDIQRTMTILIVACPCAAGLATPTALCAAIGNAAHRGILVKGGLYLEEAGRLDTILFDKTGTLTVGHPVVTGVIPLHPRMTAEELLTLAATAESNANHPLAQAVKEAARQANIPIRHLPNSEMSIGKGVRAIIDDVPIYVGSARFMAELDIVVPPLGALLASIERDATLLFVGRNQDLIGVIAARDAIRLETPRAIEEIRAEGITTIGIVTGDTQIAAEEIADVVGITDIWSNMMPHDKFKLIKTLQQKGSVVAMVGDGVNDSPALAMANVGIAMGAGGTDAAIETAGIVLREDNPIKIVEVVRLGKKSLTIIQQNFLFAIGANMIGLALGSARIISPLFAAILHNTSTLAVVLNSTRLLSYNPSPPHLPQKHEKPTPYT